MAEITEIAWADSTFNPWIGCTKVGPGCDHCYAEADWDKRKHRVKWGAGNPRSRTSAANWAMPHRWNRQHKAFHAKHGRRQRVFCASLADWLDNEVPIEWLVDLLDLWRTTPDLDWLALTKRIGNWRKQLQLAYDSARDMGMRELAEWILAWLGGNAPANVWIGATIVNQQEADRDVPKLLQVPARVRFLSCEPLLGRMYPYLRNARLENIHWVIAGGESGHGARPMHPDWARSLRDQCAAAGVPFLFKQWGEFHPSLEHNYLEHNCPDTPEAIHDSGEREYRPFEAHFKIGTVPGWVGICPIGKKAAGRLLDGREHNEFPVDA